MKENSMMRIVNFIFGVLKKLWATHRQRRLEKQKISQSVDVEANFKFKFSIRKRKD